MENSRIRVRILYEDTIIFDDQFPGEKVFGQLYSLAVGHVEDYNLYQTHKLFYLLETPQGISFVNVTDWNLPLRSFGRREIGVTLIPYANFPSYDPRTNSSPTTRPIAVNLLRDNYPSRTISLPNTGNVGDVMTAAGIDQRRDEVLTYWNGTGYDILSNVDRNRLLETFGGSPISFDIVPVTRLNATDYQQLIARDSSYAIRGVGSPVQVPYLESPRRSPERIPWIGSPERSPRRSPPTSPSRILLMGPQEITGEVHVAVHRAGRPELNFYLSPTTSTRDLVRMVRDRGYLEPGYVMI